jgi:hypothetical protein
MPGRICIGWTTLNDTGLGRNIKDCNNIKMQGELPIRLSSSVFTIEYGVLCNDILRGRALHYSVFIICDFEYRYECRVPDPSKKIAQ